MRVDAEIAVTAPPEVVWDLLADITNITAWSPECIRTAWLDERHDVRPGARFSGRNRLPDGLEWTVTCVITESSRPGALACAAGIWVPGQEELMAGYRDRYFNEVLPALVTRKQWSKSRLSRLLFPVTLVSEATIEAANAAEPSDNVLRVAVAEQSTIMRRRLAASRQR